MTSGTVKVGGTDVRDYNLKALRDQVSVVLQKNVLLQEVSMRTSVGVMKLQVMRK